MFYIKKIIKLYKNIDDQIDEIFEYKNNLILNKAIDWLVNFKSEQFYIASAVIIANYLRSGKLKLKKYFYYFLFLILLFLI